MATNYTEKPRKNESAEKFIKRFIKRCKKLGIIQEVRDKEQYISKSEKKRAAKKKAISRNKKNK